MHDVLFQFLHIVEAAHHKLPRVVVALHDAGDVHLALWHHAGGKVAVGAGVDHHGVAAVLLEVPADRLFAIGIGPHRLLGDVAQRHVLDDAQSAVVLREVPGGLRAAIGEERRLDDLGTARDAEVAVPLHAAHTADVGLSAVVGVGHADFGLLGIVAHIEVFQLDEHFRADGQVAANATLLNGDDDGTRIVLDHHLVVEVTRDVVARHIAFYLCGFLHFLVAGAVAVVGVEHLAVLRQACDRLDVRRLR